MEYDKTFINHCLEIFSKVRQNRSIQECLQTNAQAPASASASAAPHALNEQLWFIYYMFFAIHNPKMEDYIQKKTQQQNTRDIIKNMIKRRHYTSTIVFELYTHAYTNQGNVSVIYPKDKGNIANQLIKSFQSNHLKTTAVLLRRVAAAPAPAPAPAPALSVFIEYITQPLLPAASASAASAASVMNKINNHISYRRKDIIILALTCYMKIDEEDINKKNIFIAATEEESEEPRDEPQEKPRKEQRDPSPHPPPSPSPYNAKYKYLYR
jgi:hypothetical protein